MFRSTVEKIDTFLRKSIIIVLNTYRYLISPLLGARCRFYPTCSHYAKEALTEYSLIKALCLVLIRLLKCHPFHPGGFDPLKVKNNAYTKIPLPK